MATGGAWVLTVIESSSAAVRLDAARRFLSERPAAAEVVVVGASRGAADDFVRSVAHRSGATFGLTRFSLTQLASRTAAAAVAGELRTPGTQAGSEAMAARAAFDAINAGELAYFAPVASMPGFPRALARTVHELRLAGIETVHLKKDPTSATSDVGRLLGRVEEQLADAAIVDRAALFGAAADACRAGLVRWADVPIVLVDVPLDSRAEREFVRALAERSPDVFATIPAGDDFARRAFRDLGATIGVRSEPEAAIADPRSLIPEPRSDLATLRKYIFTSERPPARERVGDVRLFSAPGEGREAVEIVRRLLDEAGRGVPFDEMAVFLRTPQQYLGLLEHACARGGVPVFFDRGTRRPDPAGRAFVALLSCAVEGLSAKRFDEYLSLGQVPQIDPRIPVNDRSSLFVVPDDEAFVEAEQVRLKPPASARPRASSGEASPKLALNPVASEGGAPTYEAVDTDEEAVVSGTLRSPWKWEELIVESAVVGGRTRGEGKTRWRRRLDGLAAEYRIRLEELTREDPESARVARFTRDLRNLGHLRQFALPIIDELADWPERATWGEWLERLTALATRALGRPMRVLRTLADLRPMADVGPATLEEVRDVLHDRLVTLDWEPPPHRYGKVFVGTPHQARGRTFRVVFVPGLAERVVPQRPREDPLLLDERRDEVDAGLVKQGDRATAERLLLRIVIGAASERLYLSYPRLDVAETRARVPSFYALDVVRAMTGRVLDHRVLAAEAAEEGGAGLAWPAPKNPDRAIDDLEHDLATLKPLLDSPDREAARGRAHYLLDLNPALRRSVTSRWLRDKKAWATSDGLIRVAPGTRRALEKNRLGQRAYSLSALQRFSNCPYQFLLATIHRLEPWDEPEPIVHLDPLTRGSLFHSIQAEFFREMHAKGALPIGDRVAEAVRTMEGVIDRVAAEYEEKLVPAIERVWRDEIDEVRRDLGIWVQKISGATGWKPEYFELSFGLRDEGRDPRSLKEPVLVAGRFKLHGSVDLIEVDAARDLLRVTDHKTGRNRSNPDLVVDGGAALQPVLYSMAMEEGLGRRVEVARLFYATTAGGFHEHPVVINDYTRSQGIAVLEIIDRAVENGFLPAAPHEDRHACRYCDFRPVCGPREEERTGRKNKDQLADLKALRSMR